MTGQKTYWHLLDRGRKPTEYDVVTSNLLYYLDRGFEVNTPLTGWYDRYQKGSRLVCSQWDDFRDPRETTYTGYTRLQKDKEIYVDGLLAAIDSSGYDRDLDPSWREFLARVMGPLRYPVHGLQMIAAYIGSMAPSGRIAIAAMLQAADELRRVQRLAYRMRQIQETHPGFADDSKQVWQEHAMWQPLRELIERLLVTYDWGEALIALELAVKPVFDELFMKHLGALATSRGDQMLALIFDSLDDDCRWHREWSDALIAHAVADAPGNRAVVAEWLQTWAGRALSAARPFGQAFEAMATTDPPVDRALRASCQARWASLGIDVEIPSGAASPSGTESTTPREDPR